MRTLRIALLQLASDGVDMAANRAKGERACREAARLGADIALFPEMWTIGYETGVAQSTPLRPWPSLAIARDDEFVRSFQQLARELDIAIALTYLEKRPGKPRNSVSLIDRHGDIVMTYAKVHTCDFDWECGLEQGESFDVVEVDTGAGPVRVGTMICFDREFPESARVLMLKGAEVILVPNACELEANRLGQFKARAFENMVAMAMTNYAAPNHNGHSIVVDAVTFDEHAKGLDPVIFEAGEDEGVFVADLDLGRLRAYRQSEAMGDAYRKPQAYGGLTSLDVDEPFRRPDSRR
jgi:N-carbamoylputrescine amidase